MFYYQGLLDTHEGIDLQAAYGSRAPPACVLALSSVLSNTAGNNEVNIHKPPDVAGLLRLCQACGIHMPKAMPHDPFSHDCASVQFCRGVDECYSCSKQGSRQVPTVSS